MLYVVFFACQLINVILSTIKNVVTIKGTKITASVFSAVNYAVNTIILKTIADVPLWVAVVVSASCNLIGVYIGLWITEKMRKEQFWKITVTIPTGSYENFKNDLNNQDIDFIVYETSWKDYKVIDVFAKHKSTSKKVKEIFKNYDVKYTISANDGIL